MPKTPIQYKIDIVELNSTQILYKIFIMHPEKDSTWRIATFADFVLLTTNRVFSWELSRLLAGQRGGAYFLESGIVTCKTEPFVLVTTLSSKLDWPMSTSTGLYRSQFSGKPSKHILTFNSGLWNTRVVIPNPWLDHESQFGHAKDFFQKADATMLRKFWKHVGRNAAAYLKKHGVLFMQTDGSILRYMLLMLRTELRNYACSGCTTLARVQALLSNK